MAVYTPDPCPMPSMPPTLKPPSMMEGTASGQVVWYVYSIFFESTNRLILEINGYEWSLPKLLAPHASLEAELSSTRKLD